MMNRYIIFVTALLLGIISACDSYVDPDVAQDQGAVIDRLARTWQADQVILEGIDITDQIPDLVMSFNDDNTWAAINGEPIFSSSGTWVLVEETTDQLLLNGVLAFFSLTFDAEQMVLMVDYDGNTIGSRTSGTNGTYEFYMSPVPESN